MVLFCDMIRMVASVQFYPLVHQMQEYETICNDSYRKHYGTYGNRRPTHINDGFSAYDTDTIVLIPLRETFPMDCENTLVMISCKEGSIRIHADGTHIAVH